MLALIDGDIVAYSSAATAVSVSYQTPDGQAYRYKREAVQHCKDAGLSPSEIKREEELEPVEFALANAKRIINKIMERTECDDYKVILSGATNMRREREPTYKANRNMLSKPAHLEAVVDYLLMHHMAEVTSSGLEADDYIGQMANEGTIICTLDKDLDQIEGHHYNWRKDESYYVSSDEADLFFWMQMLMGDRADNIEGIMGVGEKTAYALLHGVEPLRRRCVVGLEYAKYFDDPEDMYKRNAFLLWIER